MSAKTDRHIWICIWGCVWENSVLTFAYHSPSTCSVQKWAVFLKALKPASTRWFLYYFTKVDCGCQKDGSAVKTCRRPRLDSPPTLCGSLLQLGGGSDTLFWAPWAPIHTVHTSMPGHTHINFFEKIFNNNYGFLTFWSFWGSLLTLDKNMHVKFSPCFT